MAVSGRNELRYYAYRSPLATSIGIDCLIQYEISWQSGKLFLKQNLSIFKFFIYFRVSDI